MKFFKFILFGAWLIYSPISGVVFAVPSLLLLSSLGLSCPSLGCDDCERPFTQVSSLPCLVKAPTPVSP